MRNELRFLANASVYIVNKKDGKQIEATLRDMSEHGLSIKSEQFLEIEPNSSYVIDIVPEKETNLEKFRLEIESRWVKINRTQMESGFSVVIPSDQKEFSDYLEYIIRKSKTENI
jgi:hypothetical protein